VAQTRKRRRRKHRGTQTGRIDQRGRAGRPRSRQEARARARKQMGQKRDRPPTWSGAAGRAGFGAAIFFILLLLLFKRPVVVAFLLSAFMFLIYIPMGHALDRFMYRRRLRSQMRQREERAERKAGE
jgi:drug/metabolite transporter (DMT)-like permease